MQIANNRVTLKHALSISLVFLLLFAAHFLAVLPREKKPILIAALFGSYYFVVYIFTLLALPKLDTTKKMIAGSVFIPIFALDLVLTIAFSIGRIKEIFDFSFPQIVLGLIISLIGVTDLYITREGWIASIVIFTILYFRKRVLDQNKVLCLKNIFSELWAMKKLLFALALLFVISGTAYITASMTKQSTELWIAKRKIRVHPGITYDAFSYDVRDEDYPGFILFSLEAGDICTPTRHRTKDHILLLCQKGEGWVTITPDFEIIKAEAK